MGLTQGDRKELESLIRAILCDLRAPLSLARRMIPRQGSIDDFAYGLISGMIIGNFVILFQNKNERQPDKDEIADLFSIMMAKMPRIRRAIRNELDMYYE
jgi:hypothetical protein